MRRVYLSFLGLGQYDKTTDKFSYRETTYELDGKQSHQTRFVQTAEQMLLGWDRFDIIYIAATDKSVAAHFTDLQEELSACRGDVQLIELDEDMSESGQWKWFEKIFSVIEEGDELCVDLTHGYRSIPVIFSTAINFLQKTKRIKVSHVFYGAYEKNKKMTPLVDMRAFYDINIWADAVTRLTDNADARGIAEAAHVTGQHQFAELANGQFTDTCSLATRKIINIDVNNVTGAVNQLLACIEKLQQNCSPGTDVLLGMVKEKFAALSDPDMVNPDRDGYTLEYFRIQLDLAALLLDHGLLMQAFTVMREWLASLVMLYFESSDTMNAGKRRKRIRRYGPVFFNMLQYPEEKWDFRGKEEKSERVRPFYNACKDSGCLQPLMEGAESAASELSEIRNGFDHAWLGKAGMKEEIEQKGRHLLKKLFAVQGGLAHLVMPL